MELLILLIIGGFLFFVFGICYLFVLLVQRYKTFSPEEKSVFWLGILSKSYQSSDSDDDDDEGFDYSSAGKYVIQYRDSVGASWVDGPGSNNEQIAENMFERFIQNDPRSNRRCRLVKKKNGRVVSVLGTN